MMNDMFDLGFDDGYEGKNMVYPNNSDYVAGWNSGQYGVENEEDFPMEDY